MVIKQNKGYKLPLSKLEIINKYVSGASCYAIAKDCNCTPQTIYSIIKKSNTQLRTLSEAATKYTHNKDFFSNSMLILLPSKLYIVFEYLEDIKE
jgi:predicted DNA-binding protein YlxM (UPF0122 family)